MQTNVLASLSNETRLKLIICLSQEEKNVTQLINKCELSQSAVSQHLEKLRTAGLVATRRDGKEIYYSLVYPEVVKVSQTILIFLEKVQ